MVEVLETKKWEWSGEAWEAVEGIGKLHKSALD
jgi:hypothetical protein